MSDLKSNFKSDITVVKVLLGIDQVLIQTGFRRRVESRTDIVYSWIVIQSIHDQTTADILVGSNTKAARKLPQVLHRRARLLLLLLDAAEEVQDMATPPGNCLHRLSGDRQGFWSVRINDQYRLIFQFEDGHAHNVQLTDYH